MVSHFEMIMAILLTVVNAPLIIVFLDVILGLWTIPSYIIGIYAGFALSAIEVDICQGVYRSVFGRR